MPDTELDYDVALSFAGEDREYVDEVASYLKNQGVLVFYDQYEKADLWGKNLYDHLAEIYSARSKYVVMFISKHYVEKVWPNHERKSASFEERVGDPESLVRLYPLISWRERSCTLRRCQGRSRRRRGPKARLYKGLASSHNWPPKSIGPTDLP